MCRTKNNQNQSIGKESGHRQQTNFGVSELHFVAMVTHVAVLCAKYEIRLKKQLRTDSKKPLSNKHNKIGLFK
jgi:hypothetical protein